MSALRIYTHPASIDTVMEHGVFYSRRAGGPYYRWCDENGLGPWRFSRVHLSKWTLRALCVSNLKSVPAALQVKLRAHYLG